MLSEVLVLYEDVLAEKFREYGRKKGGTKRNGTRNIPIAPWLSSAFGRMCHRHRKCMEISVYGRKQRRRHFRAVLPAVPCHHGSSDSVDGACHRKRKQKEYRARVWGTGKERAEVAYPRIRCPHRKLSADDVLHRRCRLDAVLFLQLFNRKIQRPDRRRRNRKIQRDAFISVDSCHYHADYYNCRLSDLFGGSAERRGACYKGDDDRVDGHHDFPCGLQLYDAGCQRGTEILSGAGLCSRSNRWDCSTLSQTR